MPVALRYVLDHLFGLFCHFLEDKTLGCRWSRVREGRWRGEHAGVFFTTDSSSGCGFIGVRVVRPYAFFGFGGASAGEESFR